MSAAATSSDLGKALSIHRFGSKAIYKDIAQNVFFLIFFFVMFFAAPHMNIKGNPDVRSPTAFAVWGAILAVLLWLLWTSLEHLKDEVRIFERGLSIASRKENVRAAWTDIEAVHEVWTHFRKNELTKGVPLLQGLALVVNGRMHEFNNHLKDFEKLADAVATRTYPLIEAGLRKQIQAKQAVAFDDLRIRYDGVEVDGRHHKWSEIKWIGFPEELGTDYFFAIELTSQKKFLWRKMTSQIPNFRVMHRLLTALRAPVDPNFLQSFAQPK
jgi:hypothetical protein